MGVRWDGLSNRRSFHYWVSDSGRLSKWTKILQVARCDHLSLHTECTAKASAKARPSTPSARLERARRLDLSVALGLLHQQRLKEALLPCMGWRRRATKDLVLGYP
ncbi:hypothetical protein GW17_00034023 [Ensete ventricosum]|nr:hypothetical protein GW17_00034023 [Ensete ventricosum]